MEILRIVASRKETDNDWSDGYGSASAKNEQSLYKF